MKQLTSTFGISLNFSDLSASQRLNELIQQYKLVVLNNVPFTKDHHVLCQFVSQLGNPLEVLDSVRALPYVIWDPKFPWVELGIRGSTSKITDLHQDGYWYTQEKNITLASVDLDHYRSGEKAGDTIFFNSKQCYDSFNEDFKKYLGTLLISHSKRESTSRTALIQQLRQRYLHRPDRFLRLHRLLKNRDHRFTPGVFDFNLLVQTDHDGTWLHYSPNGNPEFVNATQEESSRIKSILNTSIEATPYYHVWENNQLIFWENKHLVHSPANNGIGDRSRPMVRLQYSPGNTCGQAH